MVDLDDVIADMRTLDGLIDGKPHDDLGKLLTPIRERFEEMGRVLKFYKQHCVTLLDLVNGSLPTADAAQAAKEQVLRYEDALRHQVMGPSL